MKNIVTVCLISLSAGVNAENQILEQNIVSLEQLQAVSTLVLKSCEVSVFNEIVQLSKSNVPNEQLLEIRVAGEIFKAESFGLFARNGGECLLKMKNVVVDDK